MARAERLSPRLESLLEAVFQSPADPFSLYWDIAANIGPEEIALSQRVLRKKLKERGRVSPETAILVACLMNLGGFSAHRILHFISLYVPGGIRSSLFDLAVTAIFLGETPFPSGLLYDLTQYTYLEKRLLVRKSIEISDRLARDMDPRVLLYLYLLALRDDLSNEHVQLIALVLKRSLPTRELRGRIGSASLEEYGEIARAVRTAEERSLDMEVSSLPSRAARAFDRDSASYFLDKYFSDEAIAEARASAPEIPKRPPSRPPSRRSAPASRTPAEDAAAWPSREEAREWPDGDSVRSAAHAPRRQRAEAPRARETVPAVDAPAPAVRPRRTAPADPPARARHSPASKEPAPAHESPGRRPRPRESVPAVPSRPRLGRGSGLVLLPTVLAAVILAILLGVVPAGLRSGAPPSPSHVAAGASPAVTAAPAATAVAPTGAAPTTAPAAGTPAVSVSGPAVPSSSPTLTYVVKPGDSLWKIFTSLPGGTDRGAWAGFLDRTRSVNELGDPDHLRPGKVLTLSAPQ